jgi:methoxymalonate biosynthesis acyl carrier protein
MHVMFSSQETALIARTNIENSPVMNQLGHVDQHLQAELIRLFLERLNTEVPSTSTDLFETGILDSQTFVELLLHIEEKFNIHILVEQFEIANFRSIEGIANLILEHNHSTKAS